MTQGFQSAHLASRIIRHPVARNAFALYGMQLAGYVVPLLTIPYLARTLHPRGFGLLLFAQSFALWASVVIEYGFNLSATREVAQNRGSKARLAEIAAGVLGAKALLVVIFAVIAGCAAWQVGTFREHPRYLLWALPMAWAFGLSPFWYFQGTERMVSAVAVEFGARALATAGIFWMVRNSEDGWKALALQAVAGCVSTATQTIWMYREIDYLRPRWKRTSRALHAGWYMFLFRGAFNIYTTANTFILGLFVAPVQVGYYGGAERIARAVHSLTVPFTQALYPRMSHLASQSAGKAAGLARRTLPLALGSGLVLAGGLALLCRWGVSFVLGPGYESSIAVLYVFALVLPVNATNGALIMHWMLPLGMERIVGGVTLGAILCNLVSASLLAPRFAQVGMAWAIMAAETLKFMALVSILLWRGVSPVSPLRNSNPGALELS